MKRYSRKAFAAVAIAVVAGLGLAGCATSGSLGGAAPSGASTAAGGTITVGSASFPENVTLAYVYGEALAAAGTQVAYKTSIGQRAAYYAALTNGEIDLVPEYAGSILSYLDKNANQKSGADVKTALDAALPATLSAATFSAAADADSLNVTKAFATQNGLTSIADLAKLSSVTLSANPEFATRPDGIPGLKSVYGLNNITFSAINDSGGPATAKALVDGTTQVADIYSTTPSILDNGFVTLTDPKNLFASQQVVPIGTKSKLTPAVTAVLDKVSAKLTTQDLLQFNQRTGGTEKADPKTVATDWLKKNGFVS